MKLTYREYREIFSLGTYQLKFIKKMHANDNKIISYCNVLNNLYKIRYWSIILSNLPIIFIFRNNLFIGILLLFFIWCAVLFSSYRYASKLPRDYLEFIVYAKKFVNDNENINF